MVTIEKQLLNALSARHCSKHHSHVILSATLLGR